MNEVIAKIKDMSRKQVQKILEAYGFAVYDSEDLSSLREALQVNVEDGTIPPDEILGCE